MKPIALPASTFDKEVNKSNYKVIALDGLRGLAVLIVIMSHLGNSGSNLIPIFDSSGIGKGGVYLFFLLSSFLLTYPFYIKGKQAFSFRELAKYATRRILRIYPLYSLYLISAVSSTYLIGRFAFYHSPIGIPYALTPNEFVTNFFLLDAKSVAWSIVVEFKFYLILPILAYIYAVQLRGKTFISFALATTLVLTTSALWPMELASTNDFSLAPYLPVFIMGSYLAIFQHYWLSSQINQNNTIRNIVELLGVVSLLIIFLLTPSVYSWVIGRAVEFDYFHSNVLLYGVLWSTTLFSALNGNGFLRKVFETKLLRYLGLISFSAYLLHPVVIGAANHLLVNFPGKGLFVLAITILLSHYTHFVFESKLSNIQFKFYKAK